MGYLQIIGGEYLTLIS
ncbi:Protein of unknown function [Bacillus mycoides]|uniref:Uncharacterized protein n=1 Tax=Bacillus mycoides TaxID=1405 RepID=A0A1C4E634_BACMY|nr:Protein of unknown function [Bacillus mycoides]SCC39083.1 Protein of unknown function [Bacillus mycoides]